MVLVHVVSSNFVVVFCGVVAQKMWNFPPETRFPVVDQEKKTNFHLRIYFLSMNTISVALPHTPSPTSVFPLRIEEGNGINQ